MCNELQVGMVGAKVDLTYSYEVLSWHMSCHVCLFELFSRGPFILSKYWSVSIVYFLLQCLALKSCSHNRELKQAAFFEPRKETSSDHFARQASDLSQILKLIVCSSENIGESLSKHCFWAANGNRNWTFRMPGQWCLPAFQLKLIVCASEKILNNVNLEVWRQVN